jgi:hypothetical protein
MDAWRNQATVSSELRDRAIPMLAYFLSQNLVLIGEGLRDGTDHEGRRGVPQDGRPTGSRERR